MSINISRSRAKAEQHLPTVLKKSNNIRFSMAQLVGGGQDDHHHLPSHTHFMMRNLQPRVSQLFVLRDPNSSLL